MSWTFTISGSAIAKAGVGHNTIFNYSSGSAILQKWSDQAEGRIVGTSRKNWLSQYSSLGDEMKYLLDDIASSMIAMQIIGYDMGNYTSRTESQTMLDIQDEIITNGMKTLSDFKSNEIRDV